nr:MAG TPA: hypothetical protein [Caudoviricetes sp.]
MRQYYCTQIDYCHSYCQQKNRIIYHKVESRKSK